MRGLGTLSLATRALRPRGSRGLATIPYGESAIANGLPALDPERRVFITAPARTASQQGAALTAQSGAPVWRIELASSDKWINPLMGWTATGDALENVARSNLVFQSKEAAIAFAEKNGWRYEVQDPHSPQKFWRPKRYGGYGDNFSTKRKGLPAGGLPSEAEEPKKK